MKIKGWGRSAPSFTYFLADVELIRRSLGRMLRAFLADRPTQCVHI